MIEESLHDAVGHHRERRAAATHQIGAVLADEPLPAAFGEHVAVMEQHQPSSAHQWRDANEVVEDVAGLDVDQCVETEKHVDAGFWYAVQRAPVELHIGHAVVAEALTGDSQHVARDVRTCHVSRSVAKQQCCAPASHADLEDVVVRLHVGLYELPVDQLDVLVDIPRGPGLRALPFVAEVLRIREAFPPGPGVLVPRALVVDTRE
jgi:hypothetical protein